MRRCMTRWALASAIVLSPTLAAAQEAEKFSYPRCDRTPSDKDVQAAKGAFQAGNASFDEADYDRAITYWEDAYRRDCTAHLLLLNLARAYELNGKRERAIVALQTYLERSPDAASQQAQIQRRIDKLKEQLSASAPPPTPQPKEQAPVAAPPSDQRGASQAATPAADTGAETGERPLWPLFAAGGGAAVFVVGGILYLGAASDVSHFEDLCGGRGGCPDKQTADDANAARTRQKVTGVVTLVGAAAMAGGLVYYFVQKPEQTTARVERHTATLTPAVAPGFAGLEVSGSF